MEGYCADLQINVQRTKELMRMLTFSEWTGLEMDFTPCFSNNCCTFSRTGLSRNRACALINCYALIEP
jgi:hypothetical protein